MLRKVKQAKFHKIHKNRENKQSIESSVGSYWFFIEMTILLFPEIYSNLGDDCTSVADVSTCCPATQINTKSIF